MLSIVILSSDGYSDCWDPLFFTLKKYFHDIDTDVIKLFSNSLLEYEELVDDNIRKLNEETSAVLLNFLNDIKLAPSY